MNTIIKRVLAFILSFALIFSTTVSANANTSIGGWTALDTITAGANNTINATKTAGGKVLKSAITIAPQAGKVGKYLLRGGAAGALAMAVPQLLGDGIDWVLDPANNRIKYNVSADTPNTGTGYTYELQGKAGVNELDACKAYIAALGSQSVQYRNPRISVPVDENGYLGNYGDGRRGRAFTCAYDFYSQDGKFVDVRTVGGVRYGTTAPVYDEEEKYLPIDTVAAKVIANAEAGHAPSQEAVKTVALEGFAAGEHDAALEAAATEAGTENPPDTENPPKDPDAPAEPFDPAGIISAINALKALLAGILSSITSLSDFFQSDAPPDPKPEDTELDIPVPDVVPVDTDINFGGSCPANFEFNGSIFGNPINIVLLDTSKFCGFLSTFVKFPVYAASSLFALYILGGRKDV